MLFHIKQSHAPQDCPYGKGGSKSLFDEGYSDVQIRGYWLAFPSTPPSWSWRPMTFATFTNS